MTLKDFPPPPVTDEKVHTPRKTWHVSANQIKLTEDVAPYERGWIAKFEGTLHTGETYTTMRSYGPHVTMTRGGATADEAYNNLVDALREQGWRVSS